MAILAENARFLDEKITARVESGIAEPADLAGKRIGVTMGSDVHYFLYLFLQNAGLTVNDVDMVNLKPPDMVISLVKGDVDAFASWRPQPDNAKKEMGDGAIFLTQPDPPIFESLYLIVGMQELVNANPDTYERFMEAMVMADEYAASNPEGTMACVATASEVDVESAESLMAGYNFKIWLDKSMIEGSEKRAIFQLENDLAPEGAEMPDFRKFIAEGPLEAVDPDRVSLD
jgi:NitT/TauT family transport system substrate-binding protein